MSKRGHYLGGHTILKGSLPYSKKKGTDGGILGREFNAYKTDPDGYMAKKLAEEKERRLQKAKRRQVKSE